MYETFLLSCLNSFANLYRFTSEFDSIKCLGEGGFAQVYKAREKLMSKYYAIKIVRGDK